MKKAANPRAIYVEWEDAATTPGWRDDKEAKRCTLAPVHSIGWEIARNKKRILIAISHDHEGQHADRLSIPLANVRRKHYLKIK